MKEIACQACGRPFPMNKMFTLLERSLCETCGQQELDKQPVGAPPEVVRQVDPTVCQKCEADGGTRVLPLVMGLPVCDACEHELRHRPFPTWVNLSLAAMVALAVAALFYNERFFLGYLEMHRALRALEARDMEETATLMNAAAAHVPESEELRDWADLFTGIDLANQDRSAEAVPPLQRCVSRMPPGSPFGEIAQACLLQAEGGAAFDAKDYDKFLEKQLAILESQPNEPMAVAGVASAYACLYASTGLELHKSEAMRHLDQATSQSQDAEILEYRQRILHRLDSRQIITRAEYQRRFPKGWNPETTK